MIVHVTSKNVEYLWGLMEGGLKRTLTKTKLGIHWDLPSAIKAIHEGELLGFYVPESGYSGLYYFSHSPLKKSLKFFWSGKDEDNKVPVDWEEVDKYLSVIAEAYQCQIIECEGRRGWKSILEPLSYREDSVLFYREV